MRFLCWSKRRHAAAQLFWIRCTRNGSSLLFCWVNIFRRFDGMCCHRVQADLVLFVPIVTKCWASGGKQIFSATKCCHFFYTHPPAYLSACPVQQFSPMLFHSHPCNFVTVVLLSCLAKFRSPHSHTSTRLRHPLAASVIHVLALFFYRLLFWQSPTVARSLSLLLFGYLLPYKLLSI